MPPVDDDLMDAEEAPPKFTRIRTTSTPATCGFPIEHSARNAYFLQLARSEGDSQNAAPSETSCSSQSSLSPTSSFSADFCARKRISVSDEDGARSSGSGEDKAAADAAGEMPKKRRPYNPLPHSIKETPVYQDYRRRNADAVARCREKKKEQEKAKDLELEELRRANKEQNLQIEKLKLQVRCRVLSTRFQNQALDQQVKLYKDQLTLFTTVTQPIQLSNIFAAEHKSVSLFSTSLPSFT